MPISGRSVDDQPLAAYSTGVDPETESPRLLAFEANPLIAPAPNAEPAGMPMRAQDELAHPTTEGEERDATVATPLGRARAYASRNPRLAAGAGFGAVIVIGVVLLLGAGKGPSAAAATAGPSAPGTVAVAADPGSATLILTGALQATYSLTGEVAQPVAGTVVGATWADTLQNVLTLNGRVDRGTRATDGSLVLTWGLMVDGKLVTFTSKNGECTIGMASTPKAVTGSFACHKLKSDDGKYTVGASGTYRT